LGIVLKLYKKAQRPRKKQELLGNYRRADLDLESLGSRCRLDGPAVTLQEIAP
jgi:hypothetical protein